MKFLKKHSQYLKGTLPESELDAFTKEIVKDHFEKEKLQNKWGQILQDEHGIEGLTEPSEKVASSNNSGRIRFMRMALSVAASIVVLLLSWFAYQSLSSSPSERLLSEELLSKPYEAVSRKGNDEELKLKAIEAYNNRSYAVAEKYFEQINEIDEGIDWYFYIGLCQLYQKQADLAIQSFTAILEQPDKKYEIEANWYLGLAYTMNKDFTSARKHVQFVIDQSDGNIGWKIKEAKAFLKAFTEQE
ncbi:MAG: hypothetical protein MI974_06435 [Chitinophagales bacterium]|nr:hypothetical protein [Chitinophagales bacterium]